MSYPEDAKLILVHLFGREYGWNPEETLNLLAHDAEVLMLLIEEDKRQLAEATRRVE
ncbi:MAG: hypothetical protein QXJ75_05655 [Candidatus Bathyarchaeia archaeon]